MATSNTQPASTTFPQPVEIKIVVKANDQDDLNYVTDPESGFHVDLQDQFDNLSLQILMINDKTISS